MKEFKYKRPYNMIPLYEIFRKDKSTYTESRSIVAKGWVEGLVVNVPKETF